MIKIKKRVQTKALKLLYTNRLNKLMKKVPRFLSWYFHNIIKLGKKSCLQIRQLFFKLYS